MLLGAILSSRLLAEEYAGIGCVLSPTPTHIHDPKVRIKDCVYVLDARGVNPEAKAPLLRGDLITQIDGKDVAGMRFEDAMGMIIGPEGTTVEITVKRKGQDAPLVLDIVRFIPVLDPDHLWNTNDLEK